MKNILESDLSIREIIQIYKFRHSTWNKEKATERNAEGFLYFAKGGIHYDFEGFSFDANEGDVLRLPKGIPYSGYKLSSDDNEYYVADFLTWQEGTFLTCPLPHAFHPADQLAVRQAFENLVQLWERREPCRLLYAKAALMELIADMIREAVRSQGDSRHGEQIEKICAYLRSHAGDASLRMQEVSDTFYISQTHIRRLFSAQLNTSPGVYLMSVRVDMAKKLLAANRTMSVSEIAEQCGFSSVYYFSSAFKRATGMTCSQFRNLYTE